MVHATGQILGRADPHRTKFARMLSADRPLRILVIASRDPGGRQTGRKMVIATIVRSLVGLGHEVHVAAVSPAPPGPVPWREEVAVHRLEPPGPSRIAANVAIHALRGRMSLNECLYYSPRLCTAVTGLADRLDADLVVADMIRTYELAESTGRPVVVDLDDLLSERYRHTRDADPDTIVGYFGEYLPRFLRRPLSAAAARLLSLEAALLARREPLVASKAAVACLVSAQEAQRLSMRVGTAVEWSPMAVAVGPSPAGEDGATGPVFVGGMDYAANRQAVEWYRDAVVPQLVELGATAVLDVIGHCPDDVARRLASDRIRFLGYVPDLASTLRRYRVAVAPVVSGTGIKTKVLEAMGAGLCVVSTPLGVSGLPVRHRHEVLVGESAHEFALALAGAYADPVQARAIGERARRLVAEQFSHEAATARWERIIDLAIRGRGLPPRGVAAAAA